MPHSKCRMNQKSFSKSKSICVSTRRKSPWIRAIWTPPGGRKKGRLCFIKRKDKGYISNNRNFKQKNIAFLRRKKNGRQKLVDFFSIRVLFCVFLLSFQRKLATPFHARHRQHSSHAQTRSRTYTHRRIAHSTTLHFLPSPFTSTPKPLIIYWL